MFHNLCLTLTVNCCGARFNNEEDDSTESTKCAEELSQEVLCSSQALEGNYLVMTHFIHHQHSASQKLKRILVRGHANLVCSRHFLGYITIQDPINFYPLCHNGVEDLQSMFSFRSNKCEFYVK